MVKIDRYRVVDQKFDKTMLDAGYVLASGEVDLRLILAIDADEKCGKTHFALTAPGPISYIDTDLGLDGVVQKFQNDKKIWVSSQTVNIDQIAQLNPNEASAAAEKVQRNIDRAYKAALGVARTIVIDNASDLWEIDRLAELGKLDKVLAREYGPVNRKYKSRIQAARAQGTTNLILIHQVKDEYLKNERTGKKKRSGFAATGYLVDANAFMYKVASEPIPDRFHMTITDSRHNPEAEQLDISGTDLTFQTLAQIIFPDSKLEDWQ
jgi:hypothetical protein